MADYIVAAFYVHATVKKDSTLQEHLRRRAIQYHVTVSDRDWLRLLRVGRVAFAVPALALYLSTRECQLTKSDMTTPAVLEMLPMLVTARTIHFNKQIINVGDVWHASGNEDQQQCRQVLLLESWSREHSFETRVTRKGNDRAKADVCDDDKDEDYIPACHDDDDDDDDDDDGSHHEESRGQKRATPSRQVRRRVRQHCSQRHRFLNDMEAKGFGIKLLLFENRQGKQICMQPDGREVDVIIGACRNFLFFRSSFFCFLVSNGSFSICNCFEILSFTAFSESLSNLRLCLRLDLRISASECQSGSPSACISTVRFSLSLFLSLCICVCVCLSLSLSLSVSVLISQVLQGFCMF